MKNDVTTIKISKKIVLELAKLKIHPRQSYEEVIAKLLETNKDVNSIKASFEPGDGMTTIKLSKKTVSAISRIKVHPRQSYEEVIAKLLEAHKK